MSTYRYSGSPQIVTVSQTGDYDIVAYGAQGGQDGPEAGGKGAEIGSQFHLTAGTTLKLVVGGTGTDLGGGGGSFVLAKYAGSSTYVPLVIAGGGGGATQNAAGGNALVAKGSGTRTGFGGYSGDAPSGSGGAGGAGGAGLFGNGESSYAGNFGRQAEGGHDGAGGYLGGQNPTPPKDRSTPDQGGFGGGGAGSQEGSGGGGGGYTGGAGGYNDISKGVFDPGFGGGSYSATHTLSQYTAGGENLGNGKVVISPSVTCFVTGTKIRTTRGDCAVEALVVGDMAVTASGKTRPIVWIGHRGMNFLGHPRPREVMPVRIAANAFGINKPARDLLVSPGHSICVDVSGEVLVPAISLVNGSTIVQVEVNEVVYWHIELDNHDLLLAENLPAESYLDMGNRSFFTNTDVVALAASPDAAMRTHADFCRPFYTDGPIIEAVQARLRSRARAISTGHHHDPALDRTVA